MEKAEEIYVLPAKFGWSDLGTWGALQSLLPKDKEGNATVGTDVRMYRKPELHGTYFTRETGSHTRSDDYIGC